MTKVSERIFSLRGLRVVADDYFGANTTGQTHTYTLETTAVYLLICGKINATGSGLYLITANISNTMIGAIINSSVVTATASGLSLSVKVDVNYMRVTLIKVGGVISYLIHLTELLKSFCGRRWAYAESQEVADEALRSDKFPDCTSGYRAIYGVGWRNKMAGASYASIRNAYSYSRVPICRNGEFESDYIQLASADCIQQFCNQKYGDSRCSRYTLCALPCSRLTLIPREGVMAC